MHRLGRLLILAWLTPSAAPQAAPGRTLLSRHYHDGDRVAYHMTATNQQGSQTISYEANASGAAIQDASGTWHEEIGWSNLIWNHEAVVLPAASANSREPLSLDHHFCSGRTVSVPGETLFGKKGAAGPHADGKTRKQWPTFPLPKDRGSVSVDDVMNAPAGPERDQAILGWCRSVWQPWSANRQQIAKLLSDLQIVQ
jgi:hypothetical protein